VSAAAPTVSATSFAGGGLGGGGSLAVVLVASPDLQFLHAQRLREHAEEALECYKPTALVLDCAAAFSIDSAGAAAVASIAEACSTARCSLAIVATDAAVVRTLLPATLRAGTGANGDCGANSRCCQGCWRRHKPEPHGELAAPLVEAAAAEGEWADGAQGGCPAGTAACNVGAPRLLVYCCLHDALVALGREGRDYAKPTDDTSGRPSLQLQQVFTGAGQSGAGHALQRDGGGRTKSPARAPVLGVPLSASVQLRRSRRRAALPFLSAAVTPIASNAARGQPLDAPPPATIHSEWAEVAGWLQQSKPLLEAATPHTAS
jgi:anti-anti-sigma regulatory factor